ncbi:serine/threonine-protein kinase [Nonomuraea spiralis]|uniref:serine/threonine-protein kinase n=1 Tax=Nonomuraea spiralis TaxID=46182 RepID=UPI0037AE36B6
MPEQQTRLLAERYELMSPLGRGTMGTVWRARDRALGREVAVKEIRQDPGLTEEQRTELRERMVREGRLASRINHPSVAAIHDVLIQDDSPWIIMELIEARSLEQVIEEEGPLPPRLVAEIGVDLLGALRAAHSQGITHRDVKPGNVLITESGRVVLTDFGIAKAEGDSRLTKTGMVIGSPGYTAPERARGEYTGPESDIWSLGATLYFAVEGRPAYERATIAETLAALLSESADPPTQAGQLRPVLNGLLNKDYRQRLSAAKAETLMRMVADTPTSEMPALTAEALIAQETALPDPFSSSSGSSDASGAPGAFGAPGGAPGAPGGRGAAGSSRPYGPGGTPGSPASGPQATPHPAGARPAGPQGQSGPQGAGRGPLGAPTMPQGTVPGKSPHGGPGAAGSGPGAGAGVPGAAGGLGGWASGDDGDFDPERTVSVQRPKGPFSPEQGGRPGQNQDDEGAINTMRIASPRSPGQQVYPPTQQPHPQQGPGQGVQGGPQQGPGQGGPQQGGAQRPMPRQGGPQGQGLGTDLFAIAGQPEKPPAGNRNGMLVLMAVAAAAAVVIAVLIVALLSS